MVSDTVDYKKDAGNQAFKRRNFRGAIKAYTEALDAVSSITPVETQRTVLANRAQAYMSFGVIHGALRDLDRALSPPYTTQDSPKGLTTKCRYRRAKSLCNMAKYDEAYADYLEFALLKAELEVETSEEEIQLKENIVRGIEASEDSELRRKGELMRAIDARGFILTQAYRETFPLPPPDVLRSLGPDFDPDGMTIRFDTPDYRPNRRLPDPNLTPISIPMLIRSPSFKRDPTNPTPFSTRQETPVSEFDTVGSLLENLFVSTVSFGRGRATREGMEMALKHDQESTSMVLVITNRGRILVIPRSTKIRDVIAGARWPRPPGELERLPFEDLRKKPRARIDEIDGIELIMGWSMEILVVAKDNLEEL